MPMEFGGRFENVQDGVSETFFEPVIRLGLVTGTGRRVSAKT